jgi:nitroimidazol reductase NimA-like FMN-containing flavoprotein (pyridoxamine 5'-phosphate oxidase superfamily)
MKKKKLRGGANMFKEMRRKDRQLEKAEAEQLLKKCEYGILSTVGENGYAYGIPLSYVYINDAIYFHSATEGLKLNNISNNDKVSFCVVGETEVLADKFTTNYESVIVFGQAKEVSGEEKNVALLEIIDKYSKDFRAQGEEYIKKANNVVKVIKIDIHHITGKARR